MTETIAGRAPFLSEPTFQKLMKALSQNGEEARVVGGAVRDALLGRAIGDLDIATTNPPGDVIELVTKAGFKAIPTGIEHGTITVVSGSKSFEVTTLRADLETDGRHATVAFGRDWEVDAQRRDFTINALYAQLDGTVIDFTGGLKDLVAQNIRFIGEAEKRIEEDYLRIMRFFRFFAWFGKGRPDSDGIKASVRMRDGLVKLSAERVWSELGKLLAAPDPSRALLWMRQTGVLTLILPESEKWGIDAIHALTQLEVEQSWKPDPMLRLEALIPPDAKRMEAMAVRLRMSRRDAARLQDWASAAPVEPGSSKEALAHRLYREGKSGIVDRLRLQAASAHGFEDHGKRNPLLDLLDFANEWAAPTLPIKGADLLKAGAKAGPELGARLKVLEEAWIASDFTLSGEDLLQLPSSAANPETV